MTRFSWPVAAVLACAGAYLPVAQSAPNYPITPAQKATASQVAQAGVPLSELAPNAPDSYKVKRGDTLWAISGLFLKRPWRWPELWGMNIQQIRNPHLIYPGQMLYLDKSNGRARLVLAKPVGGVVKLSPRLRENASDDPISSVSTALLGPFFTDAVILDSEEALNNAPRIVATQEGRVVVSQGELAYVRGNLGNEKEFQLYREPKPLRDPVTQEVLGYEARHVGRAEVVSYGQETVEKSDSAWRSDKATIVPSSIRITRTRLEAEVGDRLALVPPADFDASPPHEPEAGISGMVASLYGDSLTAGQNQIVALNRGKRDGLERGHVLALWQAGRLERDKTDPSKPMMQLPDERQGLLYVFRVFDKMSYALILSVQQPVKPGDRFTSP
jgi:LysM domain